MEDLGKGHNFVEPADGVFLNLRDYTAVTFYVFEVDGATVATITFADDAAGTNPVTPAVIDHYYAGSADVSNGVWHRTAQTAASTVSPADGTEDSAAIYVSDEMAPDGKKFVRCGVDAGTVKAVLHGLQEQSAPENLASPRV